MNNNNNNNNNNVFFSNQVHNSVSNIQEINICPKKKILLQKILFVLTFISEKNCSSLAQILDNKFNFK